MDAKELRGKSRTELEIMAAQLRAELRDMSFKTATRQLTKVRNVRSTRKDLARVETILNTSAK